MTDDARTDGDDLPAPPDRPLRRGWTTGACATAAAKAAYTALLAGEFPDPVTIHLPGGLTPSFGLHRAERQDHSAVVSIIKDAGDDPDVTHGAEIVVTVTLRPVGNGVTFAAGPGVGTVTLPGLKLPPGEPAINPGPRAQISSNLAGVAAMQGIACDAHVTVSIPGGEQLAEKTMNGRLGIVGGLSVLGTTGVVIPYSCSSWIHSIQRGVDVALAAGLDHVAGATGRTSELALQKMFDLPEIALIDMGDFAGGLLKYLRRHPVPRVTIGGGFAKLWKLGCGAMDLHSSRSSVDFEALARLMKDLGAEPALVERTRTASNTGEVQALAAAAGLPLARAVATRARESARAVVSGEVDLDVCVFDRQGRLIGRAHG